MSYPQDPNYYGNQDNRTRAYEAAPQPYYQQEPQGYHQQQEPPRRQAPHRKFDIGPFVGGVLATAVVAFIAGWVATAIVQAVYNRLDSTVVWIYGNNDPWAAGIYGAIAALLAGGFLFLLFEGVPSPNTFFTWVVGLVIVAIIVLPFLAAGEIASAIGAAIVNGLMGFAILALLSTTSARTYRG